MNKNIIFLNKTLSFIKKILIINKKIKATPLKRNLRRLISFNADCVYCKNMSRNAQHNPYKTDNA